VKCAILLFDFNWSWNMPINYIETKQFAVRFELKLKYAHKLCQN
jgi:hypothetical protein